MTWRWTTNGMFSSTTAYAAQFEGGTRFNGQQLLWLADASLKWCIFAWLTILGKCLMAKNLRRDGLAIRFVACAARRTRTLLHMLARCPFVQSLWGLMLRSCNLLATLGPTSTTSCLVDWWANTINVASNKMGWNDIVVVW